VTTALRAESETESWQAVDGPAPVVVLPWQRLPELVVLADLLDRRADLRRLEQERTELHASIDPGPRRLTRG
jgi:hypothetical protein